MFKARPPMFKVPPVLTQHALIADTPARPKALAYEDGAWVLVVEKFVSTNGSVFRPCAQRIQGREMIVGWISQRFADPILTSGTETLLDATQNPEHKLSFELTASGWMPMADGDNVVELSPARSAEDNERLLRRVAQLENAVRILSRELETMMGLEKRVSRLEADGPAERPTLMHGSSAMSTPSAPASSTAEPSGPVRAPESTPAPAEPPPPEPEPTPVAAPAAPAPAPEPAPVASTPAPSPAAAPPVEAVPEAAAAVPDPVPAPEAAPAPAPPAATEPEPEPATEPEPEPAPEPEPEPDVPEVSIAQRFPPGRELQDLLRMLIGKDDIVLADIEKGIKASAVDGSWMASAMLSDDDQVVCVAVSDLEASVFFGGSLMMIPSGQQQEQIKAGVPDEETIEAMSEVFNNLSGPLNNIPGNRHVRTVPAEPFDGANEQLSWLGDARRVVAFAVRDHGRIAFFAK